MRRPGFAAAAWLVLVSQVEACGNPETPGAAAETVAQAPAPRPAAKLRLEIAPTESRRTLGEPVTLVASVVNEGTSEATFPDLLSPDYGFLRVQVRGPDEGKPLTWAPSVHREGRGRREVTLPPGGRLSALVPVFFARDGWFLSRPGTYEFRLDFDVGEGRLESAPAKLELREPEGDGERAAARLLMADDAARFFYLRGGDPKGAAALREILERHPDTLSAGYARLALGAFLGRQAWDPEKGAARDPDPKAASVELERSLGVLRDPVFRARCMIDLAGSLAASGRGEEARKVLGALEKEHPEIREFPEEARRLERARAAAKP